MRCRYRQSLLALPGPYLIAPCVLGVVVPELDSAGADGVTPSTGIGTARDILSGTATGMIAFTGFAVASTRSASVAAARCRSADGTRAVLEDLIASTPEHRHPTIEEQLLGLDAAVLEALSDGSPERAVALVADRTGVGLARGGPL